METEISPKRDSEKSPSQFKSSWDFGEPLTEAVPTRRIGSCPAGQGLARVYGGEDA